MDEHTNPPDRTRTMRPVALSLPAPMIESVRDCAQARGLSRNALIVMLLDREIQALAAERKRGKR